ncbi:acyltransferase [Thalassotalea nanhaiensis]|uniref:Acyltransferase n=1 Tax=Thalassotalea nanhaiensis TaxID=3065648 RepID=A0ABY9TMK8_9GAMM|nr:acyltransferase [Colwelliaceae bacterium SQ345]
MGTLKKLIFKLYSYYLLKKSPLKYARRIGVNVGDKTRLIGINSGTFGSEPFLIHIGSNVTITKRVQFLTHDGSVDVFRHRDKNIEYFGDINIGNNVFVGFGSIILPNTKIEDDVIVGAGSLVRGVLKKGGVYAGVPVKRICNIEEFHQKNIQQFTYIRNKSKKQKEQILIEKFKK